MNIYYYEKDCKWKYDIKTAIYLMRDKLENNITGIVFAKEYNDLIRVVNNGLTHNINGPALIRKTGILEYHINGRYIGDSLSNKEFDQKIKEMIFK